jgi:ABC-type multidrug transport system permease subunit
MVMIIISALIGCCVYVGGTDVYTYYPFRPNYSSAAVDNVNGSLFYALMVIGFGSVNNIVLLFPEERPIFLREVNNNMYSPSAYFFGKIISELPTSLLLPFTFGSIEYFSLHYSRAYPWSFPAYSNFLY